MRLNTKIKSKKLFKFLLITFCVIPVIFFQSSSSKNSDNDAFEREIDTLKKKNFKSRTKKQWFFSAT